MWPLGTSLPIPGLTSHSYIRVNAQQGVSLGEKIILQGDDDDLHFLSGFLQQEVSHLEAQNGRHMILRVVFGCYAKSYKVMP